MTGSTLLHSISLELAGLVDRVGLAVVHVHARRGRPAHGVVFDAGLVLTLNHAVEYEEGLRIAMADGTHVEAAVAGRDAATNLAVLRAPAISAAPLPPAAASRAGELVLAVARATDGRPLASVTSIRSTGGAMRTWRGLAFDEVVRTDGAFDSAFAGAPLVNGQGELVAVISAGELRVAGIALAAGQVYALARRLAQNGRVPRGYLGVQCQAVSIPARQEAGTGARRGLLILHVDERAGAARAGLLVGDIVIAFAGHPVADPEQLHDRLARESVGAARRVDVIRGETRVGLEVTIGERG